MNRSRSLSELKFADGIDSEIPVNGSFNEFAAELAADAVNGGAVGVTDPRGFVLSSEAEAEETLLGGGRGCEFIPEHFYSSTLIMNVYSVAVFAILAVSSVSGIFNIGGGGGKKCGGNTGYGSGGNGYGSGIIIGSPKGGK
ncbi:hypothetical protein GCK72_016316 [Caenorhabditis remanei]|uniref:Uncharacterized protein n=1 Tax=Caenorhabditis remanei TaxID=31234 RepID=A0A6A5GYT1_CAERE|nr:hypothetical protein GCK72_016316 [Caenorhabditis remanei]KAF1759849.1 hypothetical protein GCK72_016316 [Caenorhabditis remanei]